MSAPTQIAHYRITGKLGEGGMGAVYRAIDTKLNREVAIKVLPDNLGFDPDRYARFAREAQLLASLNHPNIATIYGVEDRAIVMELVEGAPIQGPLSDDQALPLINQLIDALEYAHDKTVIHRDLKPANILLTADGRLKVLDFGLAKALSQEQAPAANPSMSPTLTMNATVAGVIMGTASYMSPEQARGSNVDRRADIWSFGVVVYELLTGKQLFGGENISDVLASVLKQEIDFSKAPARFQRLLPMCLTRDPKLRLRDISGARLLLEDTPAKTEPRRSWLPWAAAALATIVAAVVGLWPKSAPPTGSGIARFELTVPAGTFIPPASAPQPHVAPSPDGKSIAFIAADSVSMTQSLWIRSLRSTTPHRADQTEGASLPFWSPDSQFVAFFADGKLKRVAVSGGSLQTICELPGGAGNRGTGTGGTWSPEGVVVFAPFGGALFRVPAMGGVPMAVTTLQPGEFSHRNPQFLPDGRLLYLSTDRNGAKSELYVQELGSAQRSLVMASPSIARWTPPGLLLFNREGTLLAQRADPKTLQPLGEPFSVAENVAFAPISKSAAFAVSQNGVLAYYERGSSISQRQLAWYDRSGNRVGSIGQADVLQDPVISPDGKSAALYVGASANRGSAAGSDTWVMDLSTAVITRLTRDSKELTSGPPVWSTDSQRVIVTEVGGGIKEAVVTSGKVSPLLPKRFQAETQTPDGRSLLVTEIGARRLALFTPGSGAKPVTLLETPYSQGQFQLSPDGKYVAFVSNEAGQDDVYVASFPSFAEKRKVSVGAAGDPVWNRNGKELFFEKIGDASIFGAEIRTSPNLTVGVPKLIVPLQPGVAAPRSVFAVTPDGQRFLIAENVGQDSEREGYRVVVNWAADLK